MALKLLLVAKPVNMGVIKDTNHSNRNQKMMQQMFRNSDLVEQLQNKPCGGVNRKLWQMLNRQQCGMLKESNLKLCLNSKEH